jgi:hypothetical protein
MHVKFHSLRGCIQKFPDRVNNEMNNNNNHSLRSNTKAYGGKTRYTDSQNSNTTAPSGRELYNLQFSLQAASPETFGYTLVRPYSTRFECVTIIRLIRNTYEEVSLCEMAACWHAKCNAWNALHVTTSHTVLGFVACLSVSLLVCLGYY